MPDKTNKVSFWSRVNHLVNPFSRDETLPELVRMPGGVERDGDGHGSAPATGPTAVQRIMPWRRHDQAISHLQHGYDKVLDLVEAIHDSLDKQNQRSAQVAELLEQVNRGLQEVPKSARQQAESFSGLLQQLEISNQHNHDILETFSDWPKTAQAQKQALDAIAAQVQASSASTDRLNTGLSEVGGIVRSLGSSLSEQIHTFKTIQHATREQESRLVDMLERQTRRLTLLVVAVLTLVAVTAIVAAISLLR